MFRRSEEPKFKSRFPSWLEASRIWTFIFSASSLRSFVSINAIAHFLCAHNAVPPTVDSSVVSCAAVRMEPLGLSGVSGRFLLGDFFINGVSLDGLPSRNHFWMSWAVRECRAFANYDFASTTRACVDAELNVDLAILRHKTPKTSIGTSVANDPTWLQFNVLLGVGRTHTDKR